jgi:protein-S-isoprenylcysteine O-methyltransferase Ste14
MVIGNIIGYIVLIGFFLIEHFVRKGKDTKKMDRTKYDKNSTTIISIVMGIAFILLFFSPLLNYLGIGLYFNFRIGICGIIISILGIIIRCFAFSTLGRFFTRTLREVDEHILVDNGIYNYIRHPRYLSDMMIFIGVSFGMGNLLSMISIPVMFIPVYIYRIHKEEKMLVEILGEKYISYKKRTKYIIPYLL